MKAFTEWEIVSRETINESVSILVLLARHDNGEPATLFARMDSNFVQVYDRAQDALVGHKAMRLGVMSKQEWDGDCDCSPEDVACGAAGVCNNTLDVDGYLRNCYQDKALPTLRAKEEAWAMTSTL